MSNEKIYVCTSCKRWLRPHADVAPIACPYCNGKLEHVPVTAEEFGAMDDATRRALADTYTPEQAAQSEQSIPSEQSRQTVTQANQRNAGKGKGCFSSIFAYIVYILISIGVFFLVSNAGNLIHQYDSLQRSASISLNEIIDNGEEFPIGEYVSLNTRWVIGPIITETSTSSWGGSDGPTATTGVDYYYFGVLEDDTIIAIKTSNSKEVETLDRMSDWLLDVYGFPMNGETILLQGKLEKMTDRELISLYDDSLSVFELEPGDPAVRYVVLDTTTGRFGLFIAIGAVVAVVVVIVLVRSSSKKKAAKKAAA